LLDLAHGSGEYKMVLVVRQDLGMTKGKVAAQVGKQQHHSAVCVSLIYIYGFFLCAHSNEIPIK